MQINDIPKRWLDILAAVQKEFPEAVLAGGALRDLYHGKPVKDLDIFVAHDPHRNDLYEVARTVLQASEPGVIHTAQCDFSSCDQIGDCYQSDTYLTADGLDVNLIVLTQKGLKAVVERIDFGFCQIGTDGVTVYQTVHRVTDVFAKTFTLVRGDTDADVERSLRRWERLKQKYPDHILVNPYVPLGF